MFFSLARRPAVKLDNPSFGVGKLAQRLAVFWKEMNTEEKEPYQKMALQDKERYAAQLKAYKRGLFSATSEGNTTTTAASVAAATAAAAAAAATVTATKTGEGGGDEESESGEGEGEDLDQLVQFYQ